MKRKEMKIGQLVTTTYGLDIIAIVAIRPSDLQNPVARMAVEHRFERCVAVATLGPRGWEPSWYTPRQLQASPDMDERLATRLERYEARATDANKKERLQRGMGARIQELTGLEKGLRVQAHSSTHNGDAWDPVVEMRASTLAAILELAQQASV